MMSGAADFLVTGGSGKLGQALARLGCTALSRTDLDITNHAQTASLLEIRRPAAVINCAAYTAVDQAETDVDAAHRLNGAAAGALAQFCAAAGVPLVHVSTDMVFADGDPDIPLNEQAWASPDSVYGASKLEGENLVRAAGGHQMVARVSWLFDTSGQSFISKILNAGQKNAELRVVTDEVGRPSFIDDVAEKLLALARRMAAGETFAPLLHLGSPGPVSRFEWAQQVFEASKALGGPAPKLHPVSADAFETPARRPRGVILDTRLADELLGPMPDWRPRSRAAVEAILKA